MSERENVSGRVDITIVNDTALTAGPFSYRQPIDSGLTALLLRILSKLLIGCKQMHQNREASASALDETVRYRACWLRHVPLLIGIAAALVAWLSYASFNWTSMTIGLFTSIVGLSAQLLLWFGLAYLRRYP